MPGYSLQGVDWTAIGCTEKGSRRRPTEQDMNVIDQHVADIKACKEAGHDSWHNPDLIDCPRCRRDYGFLGPAH